MDKVPWQEGQFVPNFTKSEPPEGLTRNRGRPDAQMWRRVGVALPKPTTPKAYGEATLRHTLGAGWPWRGVPRETPPFCPLSQPLLALRALLSGAEQPSHPA